MPNTTSKKTITSFHRSVSKQLLAQVFYVYQSNSHQNTSKVKTRGEVVASKRKIYKQKGTGRARHGALSAPIFVGGGVVHGPNGIQAKRKKLTAKMKKIALLGALSILQEKKLLDLFTPPTGKQVKTKQVLKALPKKLENQSVTLVQHQFSTSLLKAFNNLKHIKIIPANQLNAYHVLQAQHLLFTPSALKYIENKLKAYAK